MEPPEGLDMRAPLVIFLDLLTLWTAAGGAAERSADAVYYRVHVDSFKDGDGDGLGDLAGATQKISYVKALGADAALLSPLAARSADCRRPGTIDLANIDDRYGTPGQLAELLSKAKKIDLKVLVTLPVQTISVTSEWFRSSANKTLGFEDWIYWREGVRDHEPPVSYCSIKDKQFAHNSTSSSSPSHYVYIKIQAEEGVAWKWHEERSAWWGGRQDEAVLNLCSSGVSAALSAAQCTWIGRGVSGLLISPDYPTEPSCGRRLLRQMVSGTNDCARASNVDLPVILVESSLGIDTATDLYGEDNGAVGIRLVSNALALTPKPTTPKLALRLHTALMYASDKSRPVWLFKTANEVVISYWRARVARVIRCKGRDRVRRPKGADTWGHTSLTVLFILRVLTSELNHDRITSRYGAEMVDTVNLLALVLPGSVLVQQGDELGAPDALLEWLPSPSDKCWPDRPQPSAAPFPWDDTVHGGFTSNEPWLPLAPNFRYVNAKTQFGSESSHVSVFRVAAAMRRSPAMGPYVEIIRLGDAVAVLRWGGVGTLLLVCNPSGADAAVQLSRIPGLPRDITVAASSAGSRLPSGTHLQADKVFELTPGEALLFAGPPRHCGGPGPVDKIANKLSEGWQTLNKYFSNM
ncbi:Maltase A2 [Eumeta japonica]|uniref:alpha-glucosidase n=1 Tax=Eumeta variegata TaxID=151549 RepID=A0A4C1WQR6_EUMVA|nr:Maltase A2 [Eumeta japonica]